MNKFIGGFLLLVCAAMVAAPALAFRCGSHNQYLAAEGMHKFQILADCGEPVSREIVGEEKNRILEEWLYIIDDSVNLQMYLIKFDRDGYADKIEWLGKVK